jgi:hypothetical protein
MTSSLSVLTLLQTIAVRRMPHPQRFTLLIPAWTSSQPWSLVSSPPRPVSTSAATREAYLASSVRERITPPPSKRPYLVGSDIDSSLALNFHAASVTGVDIDPKLVAQASKLLALRSSRARPPTKECARIVDYFPQSAVLEHGFIDSPADSTRFFAADWAATADFSGPFDVILALSVSINPPLRPPTLSTTRSSSGSTSNILTKDSPHSFGNVRRHSYRVVILSSSYRPGNRTRKLFAQARLPTSVKTSNCFSTGLRRRLTSCWQKKDFIFAPRHMLFRGPSKSIARSPSLDPRCVTSAACACRHVEPVASALLCASC